MQIKNRNVGYAWALPVMNEGTSKLRTEACNKVLYSEKHTGYFHNYTDMVGIFDQFS